jgi:serine/threonine protein kinase
MSQPNPKLSVAERVDAACDRFEKEWQTGHRPRVEDYVSAAPVGDREELRRQLLALELELQSKSEADTSDRRSSLRSPASEDPNRTVQRPRDADATPASVGRFQVRGVLGNGAFGRVYRAFDPQLGREVAVKVPLEEAVGTASDRERFLREARAAATINHPNVCQIHEVGEQDGRPYIVMALVPGQSLAEILKARKTPMAEKQTALIVRKVALALAIAHEKGVVHRDLKPANIMFDRERKDVIVMDFGLARGPRLQDARGTQSGVILGTPAYMSPEQARGGSKDVGPVGDVFSLGVVLYELLTGARPFTGTASEVLGQILHVAPAMPSKVRKGIDPRLEAICMKAMAKRPEERFASMRELAAAIDGVLRAPISSQPAAETQLPIATRRNDAETSRDNMANLFDIISLERKAARAETAAAVDAAISKYRTPRWVLFAMGLIAIVAALSTASQMLGNRGSVTVTLELTGIDLTDTSLSFTLDSKPISAEALSQPIKLDPGEHELVVLRSTKPAKRLLFTVVGGREPRVVYRAMPAEDDSKRDDQAESVAGLDLEHTLAHSAEHGLAGAAFASDDRIVTLLDGEINNGDSIAVWDAKNGKQNSIVRSGLGQIVATGTDVVLVGVCNFQYPCEVLDLAVSTNTIKRKFAFDTKRGGRLTTLQVSPDGKSVLASRSYDSSLDTVVFDIATGEYRMKRVDGLVSCFVPGKGQTAPTILVGFKNELREIEVATGKVKRIMKKHKGEIHGLACSPDGGYAVSSANGTPNELIRWDLSVPDGAPVVLGESKAAVNTLAFSPNGRMLVTGSQEGVLKLWDVPTRRELFVTRADDKVLTSVAFSPDGARVLSAGWSGSAKLWKLKK